MLKNKCMSFFLKCFISKIKGILKYKFTPVYMLEYGNHDILDTEISMFEQ